MTRKKKLSVIIALILISVFAVSATAVYFIFFNNIRLNVTSVEMPLHEEFTLTASNTGNERVRWKSSNQKVAFVEDGKITSFGLGSARITVSAGNKTAYCDVYVVKNETNRALFLSSYIAEIEVGKSVNIDAALKENGETLDYPVSWAVLHSDIASVEDGVITGLARGSTKVLAYATYKGQEFSKEILVNSRLLKNEPAELHIEGGSDTATFLPWSGDATTLGFKAGEQVYEYKSGADGKTGRLWAEKLLKSDNTADYDKLIFDIKFDSAPAVPFTVMLGGHYVQFDADLKSGCYCANFFDTTGAIATSFDIDKVYKMVITTADLGFGEKVNGETVYEFGIDFGAGVTAYIADISVCSSDYYLKNYKTLEQVNKPRYDGLYFVYPETIKELNKSPDTYHYDTVWIQDKGTGDIWNERAAISGVRTYRDYNYFGFDFYIDFEPQSDTKLKIFNGGLGVTVYCDGDIVYGSDGGEGDVRITLNGIDVTGTALQKGKFYTLTVKISKVNLQNEAFGFIAEPALGDILLAKPFFI